MQGNGVFKQADKSVYKGEFKKGSLNGQGTYKWADNDTYTGKNCHMNQRNYPLHNKQPISL